MNVFRQTEAVLADMENIAEVKDSRSRSSMRFTLQTTSSPTELYFEDLLTALARRPTADTLAKERRRDRIKSGLACPCGLDRTQLNGKFICMVHGDGALFRKGYAKAAKQEEIDEPPVHTNLLLVTTESSTPFSPPGDEGIQRVANAIASGTVSLTSLSLVEAGMGEHGALALAAALPSRPTLTRLDLTGNRDMGATGGAALAAAVLTPGRSSLLQSLSLYDTRLGLVGIQAIAKALRKNRSLLHLDACSNRLGVEGAQCLAEALNDPNDDVGAYEDKIGLAQRMHAPEPEDLLDINWTLENLELGNNQLGNAGGIAFASVLKHSRHLRALSLYSNGIGSPGAKELCSALGRDDASLRSLDLQDNPLGERGARDVGIMLRKNASLTSLVISGRHIGEGGVTALSFALSESNRTLARLDLSSWLPRAGDSHLLEDQRPRKFGERGGMALGDVLANNSGLQHLNLEGNALGDAGARKMLEGLRKHRGTLLTLSGLTDGQELSPQGQAEVEAALEKYLGLRPRSGAEPEKKVP